MSEESQEEVEARMDREIAAVIDIMKQEWPACVDYNQPDDGPVQILDANGGIITTITSDRLDEFWNLSEGALLIKLPDKTVTVFLE